MFKFKEGAQIAIKTGNTILGLSAGECGTVWALYDTRPPAYEVAFRPESGNEFDALMYEEEMTEPTSTASAPDSLISRPLASV